MVMDEAQSDPMVIIPVHNAHDCLNACLDSLDTYSPDARVLLIDDASTDERMVPVMESWCEQHVRRELLLLNSNLGFVGAANCGAARSGGNFVLLNSDTLVTPGWLEALSACLHSSPDIATATPWSNNAEIASVPEFCQANPVPADLERWSRAAASLAGFPYPDLPTAVGFCMAVSARAYEQLGLFDEQTFGKGYGEENDFSLRAVNAGMRNVLCVNAFVAHLGGQSFGPLGLRPDQFSMQRLLTRHPAYLDLVTDWIARDPLQVCRTQLLHAYKLVE